MFDEFPWRRFCQWSAMILWPADGVLSALSLISAPQSVFLTGAAATVTAITAVYALLPSPAMAWRRGFSAGVRAQDDATEARERDGASITSIRAASGSLSLRGRAGLAA
jgi:hypothetical protein